MTLLRHSRAVAHSLLLFLLVSAKAQKHRDLLLPEDRDISMTGTIRLVHDFGPPGFGETPKIDSHVSYWALETSVPVNTACAPEQPQFGSDCRSTRRINLFFKESGSEAVSKLPAVKWKNQLVIVYGKLHRADTAGEMTPLYINVTKIISVRRTATH